MFLKIERTNFFVAIATRIVEISLGIIRSIKGHIVDLQNVSNDVGVFLRARDRQLGFLIAHTRNVLGSVGLSGGPTSLSGSRRFSTVRVRHDRSIVGRHTHVRKADGRVRAARVHAIVVVNVNERSFPISFPGADEIPGNNITSVEIVTVDENVGDANFLVNFLSVIVVLIGVATISKVASDTNATMIVTLSISELLTSSGAAIRIMVAMISNKTATAALAFAAAVTFRRF